MDRTGLLGRGSVPTSTFPGYFLPEASTFTSQNFLSSTDLRAASTDFLPKDVLPLHPTTYRLDDGIGLGVRRDPGLNGYAAGASIKGYPPSVQDLNVMGQRRDVTLAPVHSSPGIPDLKVERPSSSRMIDGPPVPTGESSTLFVDGLPSDCTRREVGHLFRPFIGFKEIRLIHKEPRRSGDKAMVLCFVEFDDSKCALTALEALQGYKFDHKKPDSPVLRIHVAKFPFRLPSDSDRDDLRFGSF